MGTEARLKTSITMDDTQFHAAMRKCSQAAASFAASMGSAFKAVAVGGIAALTAGVLGAAAAMSAAMKTAMDLGGKFNDLAAQTGGAINKLALLELAFDNAGVGGDQLGAVLNKLQKAIAAGNPAIEALGLSLDNLRTMSPDDQLEVVGRAIAKLNNPTEQAARAMEIFGKSGGKLLAVFKDDGALDNARLVLGSMPDILQENAALFDKLGDGVDNIAKKWDAFAVGLSSKIAPALEGIIDRIISIDTAKIGEALGKDIANAFANSDIYTNLLNLSSAFVKMMSVAITSSMKLLTAGLMQAFREPIIAFQANLQAYMNRALAMGRGENVDEITPDDRNRAGQMREDLEIRKEDFKQRGAAFLERKKLSPGYENSPAGQAEKRDITERGQSIQTLTKIFSDLQTRINQSRQFDPEMIAEDMRSRGGARIGFGDGKSAEELTKEALKDVKDTFSNIFPRASEQVANAFNRLAGTATNLGAKMGALTGANEGQKTTVPNSGTNPNATKITSYNRLQESVSPWEANQARSTIDKAVPNLDMMSIAGLGIVNDVTRLATGRRADGSTDDSVLRQPSKLSAGVRKRGESKEEFRDRLAGVQKEKNGENKQMDTVAKGVDRIATRLEAW